MGQIFSRLNSVDQHLLPAAGIVYKTGPMKYGTNTQPNSCNHVEGSSIFYVPNNLRTISTHRSLTIGLQNISCKEGK